MLRPYQQECIDTCLKRIDEGVKRQAVSLPVGSGKTVVFSNLIKQIQPPTSIATKTLVLAHREELLEQAARQIMRASPDLVVDIDQGRRMANPAADVIVASVPTLGRANSSRIKRFEPNRFKCIVIDEAHHAAAMTYRRIIDYFCGIDVNKIKTDGGEQAVEESGGQLANEEEQTTEVDLKGNQDLVVWGCSATLRRHDGLSLNHVFDEIVYQRSFFEMINEGFLCPMQVVTMKTRVSLDKVRSQMGDFSISSLSEAVNENNRNLAVVSAYHDIAQGRKSVLVFGVDVAHVNTLKDLFIGYGVKAEAVLGSTPTAERERILDEFRAGKIPVLVNCGILTEGTDIPNIDCVLMARPTRSLVLFQQMIGRGVRLFEGKKNCLIIDFVDMFSNKTSVVTVPSLLGLDPHMELNGLEISDNEAMQELQRQQEERKVRAENQRIIEEMIGDISHEEIQQEIDDQPLESIESLKELGFQAHLHLNPLNFFDLNAVDPTSFSARHSSNLDAISCGNICLRSMSQNAWVNLSRNRYALSVAGKQYFVFRPEDSKFWTGSTRTTIKTNGREFYSPETNIKMKADSLEYAIRGMDTYLSRQLKHYEMGMVRWSAPWRSKPPTTGQISMLERMGVRVPPAVKRLAEEPKTKSAQGTSVEDITRVLREKLEISES
ncbi:DEAD DEAH box helicase, partial [Linderina macrospora]